MLEGKLTVKEVGSNETHSLNLMGYDFRNSVVLYAWADRLKDLRYFGGCAVEDGSVPQQSASGVVNENNFFAGEEVVWEPRHGKNHTRFLSVGTSKMVLETYDIEPGWVLDDRSEIFNILGSTLRGMKNNCVPVNRDDFYDIGSNEFEENKKVHYTLNTGKVVLQNGTIIDLVTEELELDNLIFSVELHWNSNIPDTLIGNKPENYENLTLHYLSNFAGGTGNEFESMNLPSGELFSLDEIVANNPQKSFKWLLERDYRIVRKEDLNWLKGYLLSDEHPIIAFDTETTGLDINFKSQVGEGDQLVGMVFSVKPGESFYVPLRHRHIENVCEEYEIDGVLDEYFKEVLETRPLLVHNASFDWKVMYVHDINCNIVEDTLTLFHLSMGTKGDVSGVGLKTLANEILSRDSLELSDFVSGTWGMEVDFRDLPEESTRLYACADTDNTLELYLWAEANDIKLKYGLSKHKLYELEVKFSKAIGYQEFYGHKVAVDRAVELTTSVQEGLKELEKKIYGIAGHEFNVGSAVQLRGVLYDELGAPVLEYTQSGAPSTSKGVLKKLKKLTDEAGNPQFPIVEVILELKELTTLYNNFLKKLPSTATEDGFLFSRVRQFLETGRVSITSPNYQSYNDTVKKYIVPRQGYYMVDADYSAVEYRVLASMSGQDNLIESFKDPDLDYHTVQAARMFNVPYESVTKAMRGNAKGINFGVPYGLGNKGLGGIIFGAETVENTRKAADLKEKYFEGQDKVRAFFEVKRQFGVDNLYAETLLGRRRYFDPKRDRVDSIRRAAGNMPIQGTAADLYKTGMVRFFSWIQKNNLMGDILLTGFIHDEVLLEVREGINPLMVLKYLKAAMKINIKGWAPLEIGCGFGRSWYEAKSTELPIYLQDELIESWDRGTSDDDEDTNWEYGGELSWWGTGGKYDQDRLTDWEKARIFRHQAERVRDYVLDPENKGQVVKAAINSNAHDAVRFAMSGEFQRLRGIEEEWLAETGEQLGYTTWIQCDVEELKDGLDIVGTLRECCKLFGEEMVEKFDQAGLRNPNSEVAKTKSNVEKAEEAVKRVFEEDLDMGYDPSNGVSGEGGVTTLSYDKLSSLRVLVNSMLSVAMRDGQAIHLDKKIVLLSMYSKPEGMRGGLHLNRYNIIEKEVEQSEKLSNGSLRVFLCDSSNGSVWDLGTHSIQLYLNLQNQLNLGEPVHADIEKGKDQAIETLTEAVLTLENGV